MIFRFVVIRVFFIGTLLCMTPGYAAADNHSINLVTGSDYAPYVSRERPEGGVISEIVVRVFAEMGYQSELHFYPWNRAYQRVLNLESDATFPYAWGAGRATLFLYSRPVNRINIRVFMHEDARFRFSGPNDLAGLSYCQPLGYQTEPELKSMIEQADVERFEARDMDGCFEMLSAKRVGFVISNDLVGWTAVKRALSPEAARTIVVAEKPFRAISEYLIISKQHPNGEFLIKTFNASYERLLENGSLDRIWRRHLGPYAKAVD